MPRAFERPTTKWDMWKMTRAPFISVFDSPKEAQAYFDAEDERKRELEARAEVERMQDELAGRPPRDPWDEVAGIQPDVRYSGATNRPAQTMQYTGSRTGLDAVQERERVQQKAKQEQAQQAALNPPPEPQPPKMDALREVEQFTTGPLGGKFAGTEASEQWLANLKRRMGVQTTRESEEQDRQMSEIVGDISQEHLGDKPALQDLLTLQSGVKGRGEEGYKALMESLGAPADAKFRAQWEQQFNTPANRADALKLVDMLEKAGILTPEGAAIERGNVPSNPYDVKNRLGKLVSGKDVGIKKEKEKNPILIARAARTQEAKAEALEKLPATQAIALGDQLNAVKQLDVLMSGADSVDLQFGPTDVVRALNPWDTSAKGFQQLVYATKQIIGKGLEGGVLRAEDEHKYDKIIPKLGNTRPVLQKKYEQLREMIINKYQSNREGLEKARYDVTRFEPTPGARRTAEERLQQSRAERSGAAADLFD
jgi:hypothetical protein